MKLEISTEQLLAIRDAMLITAGACVAVEVVAQRLPDDPASGAEVALIKLAAIAAQKRLLWNASIIDAALGLPGIKIDSDSLGIPGIKIDSASMFASETVKK